MMCGNENIRYVHIVQHKHNDIAEEFRVGCTCAGKMTNDYFNPERREKELRSKANRRINWAKKDWKRTKTGNYYLKIEERFLLIYRDKSTNQYKVSCGKYLLYRRLTYGLIRQIRGPKD